MTKHCISGDRVRFLAVLAWCAAALLVSNSVLTADEWDKKTVVTFNQPVEVPGKVLPAGTYVFKLLDSSGNRNIVQIYDKDETQLYATVLAIPDYRMNPPEKPLISFEERPSGQPEALKAWFYPGDNFGQQFVYTHNRATQLAKRTNQNVLAMNDEMAQHITAPVNSANHPSARNLQKTDVKGVTPTGDQVDMGTVVSTKPSK